MISKIFNKKQINKMTNNILEGLGNCAKQLRPPRDMTVSEFSEEYISLSSDNALPGAFVPFAYQEEPLDSMGDKSCHTVTLEWAAQVGKSQLFLNTIAYFISNRPSNMMMVLPTASDVDAMKTTKLDPILSTTKGVKNSVAKPRGRIGKNNQSMITFMGGNLFFATAGAARTLRSKSVPVLIMDEISTFPEDTGEGSPLLIARNRTKTFGDRKKILQTSTPTVVGDAIDLEFRQGDQRYFNVPCPHCSEEQQLLFENLHIPKDKDEKTGDINEWYPEEAFYAGKCCGETWTDADKIRAVSKGRWIPTRKENGHRSYQLNEMYSPLLKWRDTAKSYVDARETYDLQSFFNNSMGQPWEDESVKIDAGSLMSRAERFDPHSIPKEVVMLTTGTDVQSDRIETQLTGWGKHEDSYVIEQVIFNGDPNQQDVWDDLGEYLRTEYTHPTTGKSMRSTVNLIDSGYLTPIVNDFCRRTPKTLPCKGSSSRLKSLFSHSKSGASHNKLVNIDTITAKMVITGRTNFHNDVNSPEVHFSDGLDEEWYKQFTSEKLIRKRVKGRMTYEFVQMRPRNEALDCYVYSYVAMKLASPKGMRSRHNIFYRGVESEEFIVNETKREEEIIENDPLIIDKAPKKRHKQRPPNPYFSGKW